MTVWEIFSEGAHPYWEECQDTKDLPGFVVKGGRLSKPGKCPEEVWKVMSSCWAQQPSQRPSMDAVETLLNNFVNLSTVATTTAQIVSYE